jgi:hypothetical protein
MSRIAITLDEHALGELTRRAQTNSEPIARTAARFVRDGLLSTQATQPPANEPTPPAGAAPPPTESTGRPGWLEPADSRETWRRELWAAVSALAERYPQVFSQLTADWYTSRQLVESLAALSAWRSQLDAGQTTDPRAELLFHDRLEILERQLTHNNDPTAARFTAGPPPSEWVS